MIRKTRPTSGNKYFITKGAGGYSTCIVGKPTDSQCNVLANCVGYACGAFNEELNLGYEKYHLNCNAEDFIERAIASGLNIFKNPHVGDIICWGGAGSLAGHVAIVIEVIDSNTIRTAESGYGSSNPFWITTRKNNNGRWGMNSNYPLRGFIENPNYRHDKPVTPTPTPSGKFNIGDEVILNGPIYVNSNATTPANTIKNKKTKITRKNPGSAHPYNTTGDLGWCDESSLTKVQPIPKPETFKVGDKVVPLTLVDYNGTRLIQYDPYYYITQISGNRAVLSANRNDKYYVWAALNTNNIKKI